MSTDPHNKPKFPPMIYYIDRKNQRDEGWREIYKTAPTPAGKEA